MAYATDHLEFTRYHDTATRKGDEPETFATLSPRLSATRNSRAA